MKKITRKNFFFSLLLTFSSFNSYSADYVISLSPLHLAFPIVEGAIEVPVGENMSVSGIFGYGSISVTDAFNRDVTFPVWEAGTQLRYYPNGSQERGLQIGIEAMYVNVDLDDEFPTVTVDTNGYSIGPFIGYKWNFDSNAVIDLQFGFARYFAQVKAKDSFGNEIESSANQNGPLLNINAGYAF